MDFGAVLGDPAAPMLEDGAVARPERLRMKGILGDAFPGKDDRSAEDHGRLCSAMRVAKMYHKERREKEKLQEEQEEHPEATLLRDIAWGKTLTVRGAGRACGASLVKVGRAFKCVAEMYLESQLLLLSYIVRADLSRSW